MDIKIESGANVQITDKPIYNIYGDVVNEKKVFPPVNENQENSHIHKPESRKADKKPIVRQRMTWNENETFFSLYYQVDACGRNEQTPVSCFPTS